MRSSVIIVLVALLDVACATHRDLKTGHIDIDRAISSTKRGQAAREAFVQKQREAEAALQPLIDRHNEIERGPSASTTAVEKREMLEQLRGEIHESMRELEDQLRVELKRLEAPLTRRIVSIIEEIGREEQFDLIVNENSGNVIYSRPGLRVARSPGPRTGIDLTDQVVREMDRTD